MSQSLLESQSLLDRFDISADDLNLLQKCGEALGVSTIDRVVDRFYEWLPQQPEFNVFFSSQDTVDRVKRLQRHIGLGFSAASLISDMSTTESALVRYTPNEISRA